MLDTYVRYLWFKFHIKPCKEHKEINHEQIEGQNAILHASDGMHPIKHGFLTIGFSFFKKILHDEIYVSYLHVYQI